MICAARILANRKLNKARRLQTYVPKVIEIANRALTEQSEMLRGIGGPHPEIDHEVCRSKVSSIRPEIDEVRRTTKIERVSRAIGSPGGIRDGSIQCSVVIANAVERVAFAFPQIPRRSHTTARRHQFDVIQ